MTDKELLLLAVKAAGIEHFISENKYIWEIRTSIPADGYYKQEDDSRNWNPLINDGDALRLAVNLHINLDFESYVVTAYIHDLRVVEEFTSKSVTLVQAARRAIVRAAAEIGRSMT